MNISGIGQNLSAVNMPSGKDMPSHFSIEQTQQSSINKTNPLAEQYPDFQHSGTAIMQSLEGIHSTDREDILSLGRMALGGEQALEEWRKQGLEITDETLFAAGKSFQDAFKENSQNNKAATQRLSGSALNNYNNSLKGFSFNIHQIVMDAQSVPDWFNEEYQEELSLIDNPDVKKAFEEGASYHVIERDLLAMKAINAYEETNNA